ncbi:hypothetical protein M441DRAFT_172096 [Trichoderma asperellum CBS 433.97]|uniref:NACHT domain-containing protein n=1 Tax=Trichoderma asperellum (strain ATCC 204424 / CBS 433.97 / NBRC 101777) TaxID=1042311 RepID=A0A2T3Z124_TRIA4|nr:hypothetical protein M441DRAFT_172096 [Trichoderma asperellum CBS 433.97]PTB38506.1 hypothetical protein M441DRAFT_172096 [Trichoderma asperellum CBS 433.97]
MASSQTLSGNKFGNSNNVHQGDNIYNDCQIVQAENDSDNVYLRDLSQTDPRLDKMRILETKGPLLRESYSWILGHRDFQQWLDAQNGILWIKGDPGKGKTMLLCGVIESLEENNDTEDDIAYFFCQATDSRINTAAAILGGLTFGLARRKTSLLSYVREKHLSPGKSLFDNPNSWVAICDIFETVIQDSTLSRIVLIVDALDECVTTNRDSFLRLVVRTSSRVKWLLSSRNLEDIQQRLLSKDSVNPLSLELKENAEAVSQAVRSYIDHCVAHLEFIQESEELKTKVRDTLERKANDTFLWVALVLHQLQDAMEWEVLEILEQMPEGLNNLYDLMMNQIQKQPQQRRDFCIKLLSIAISAYQPLHLEELNSVWQVEAENPRGQRNVRKVAQLCGSFLTVKDDIVYFIHQSAKDFVLKQGSQAGIASKHYYIFKSSLDTMSKSLHRNIYGIKSPGTRIRNIATPRPDPLAYIRYQCIFWIDHLLAANKEERDNDIQDCGNLYTFFTKMYLYWLEALSILRSMDHPVTKMYELDAMIQQQGPPRLRGLLEDAIRFIQYNRGIIEAVPLQTYFSAVAFAPECSLIRKAFISNVCEGVPRILNQPNTWESRVQSLFGHEDIILSLAFSPDSQLLVSRSEDGTARVWETKTGNCQRILPLRDHHSYRCHAVLFSPDSKQIVSMDTEKICLWNIDTPEKMHTLHIDKKRFLSVAFASDSKLLALAHFDMSVYIWCTETGNLLQTLPTPPNYTRKGFGFGYSTPLVAFSPDLKRLAVGASVVITVWDIEAAKEVCSLPHRRNGNLETITFSPNSKLLASVERSFDYQYRYSINVWCITTGRKLKSYQGELCNYFLEGKLVFTSNTELVKTTTKGLYRWQFQSSSDMVLVSDIEPLSITDFSPDMTCFAGSDGYSNTIRIWQLPPGNNRGVIPKKDHLSDWGYLWVNISPDSSVVASWSFASTKITLQRTDTGECFAICKGHHESVTAIAFSPDSSTLISVDKKRILRLWKLDTGECRDVLSVMELQSMDEDSQVSQIAVSVDMDIIACGQSRGMFILQRNNEKEYRCIAEYSAPRLRFGLYVYKESSTKQMAISFNSVFITWRAMQGRDAIEEHWRVDINEAIDVRDMPYRYSLDKRGIEQAHNKVYMIPYNQQWRGETDSSQFSWVTKNNERLVWIPDGFRPQRQGYWDSSGSIVAIGMSLDLTIIIDFSRQLNSIIDKDDETKILKRKREDSDSEAAIVKQPKTFEEFKNV